jgi:EAL domain-containing protein (putative c-di-GMP-specific phosphodiesterase class I)
MIEKNTSAENQNRYAGQQELTANRSRLLSGGTVLFQEGESGDCAYYIENGEIELTTLIDGHAVILGILGAGEMLGEMALLDNQMRTATAIVKGQSAQVIQVRAEHLLSKLKNADPLISLVLKAMLHRFRQMHNRLNRTIDRTRLEDFQPFPTESTPISYNEDSQRTAHDLKSEIRLRTAIEEQELEVFCQPIVSLASQRADAAELLLRWRHPTKGLLGPGNIIETAERTGLIVSIGYWLIEQACLELARIDASFAEHRQPCPIEFLSINVSPSQLLEEDFVDRLEHILRCHDTSPDRIKLEITETMMMEHPKLTESKLRHLRERGMHIALDDFGTGYSSLTSLMDHPIDTLKIDRSFISRMIEEPKARKIVKGVLSLARDLRFRVIAEGVESIWESNLLKSFGCDSIQGFLYYRPMPLRELRNMCLKESGLQ